jgi:CheY-like chemotaxis protein
VNQHRIVASGHENLRLPRCWGRCKANLDILVEGLKSDHKLSLALDGEMALQIAARTPPDLVLLDIVMPGLDGYEVCRRLRQMPETAEVPIMFLSSSTRCRTRRDSRRRQ